MIEVVAVQPMSGRSVQLTLTDGSVVVRDLTPALEGSVFGRIRADDEFFRLVHVAGGTIAWPNGADIAPETLIWPSWPVPEGARPPALMAVIPPA